MLIDRRTRLLQAQAAVVEMLVGLGVLLACLVLNLSLTWFTPSATLFVAAYILFLIRHHQYRSFPC